MGPELVHAIRQMGLEPTIIGSVTLTEYGPNPTINHYWAVVLREFGYKIKKLEEEIACMKQGKIS